MILVRREGREGVIDRGGRPRVGGEEERSREWERRRGKRGERREGEEERGTEERRRETDVTRGGQWEPRIENLLISSISGEILTIPRNP